MLLLLLLDAVEAGDGEQAQLPLLEAPEGKHNSLTFKLN